MPSYRQRTSADRYTYSLEKSITAGFTIACTALGLLFSGAIHAADITVADGITAIDALDEQCSLNEAIVNANDDAATHADCPAGTGADTLSFTRKQQL